MLIHGLKNCISFIIVLKFILLEAMLKKLKKIPKHPIMKSHRISVLNFSMLDLI